MTNDCVPGASLPSASLPSASLPGESLPGDSLPGPRNKTLSIFLVSVLGLFLELMLIR